MSALHNYLVLLVMFAGSAVAVASINDYENHVLRSGKVAVALAMAMRA